MEHFTPWESLGGGALIGLAAAALLAFNGRMAGISGILGGALAPAPGDVSWRLSFLIGLVAAGAGGAMLAPGAFEMGIVRSPGALVGAGLLVGVGTHVGSGCTSGHGVCGISRLSGRSLAATLTFMATGALVAGIVSRFFGGVV